jgi:hypothetical protein
MPVVHQNVTRQRGDTAYNTVCNCVPDAIAAGRTQQMTKDRFLNEEVLRQHRDSAGRRFPRTSVPAEHLINQPLGSNVLHVHLETSVPDQGDV